MKPTVGYQPKTGAKCYWKDAEKTKQVFSHGWMCRDNHLLK
jgi:hypothetical protein